MDENRDPRPGAQRPGPDDPPVPGPGGNLARTDPDGTVEPAREPAPGSVPGRGRAHHGLDDHGKVRTTRAGAWWTALVAAAVISILILVFIVQNGESVAIRFLGFEGELPLAVALIAAAVAGALVVAIPGVFRIVQLRRALARNAKEV